MFVTVDPWRRWVANKRVHGSVNGWGLVILRELVIAHKRRPQRVFLTNFDIPVCSRSFFFRHDVRTNTHIKWITYRVDWLTAWGWMNSRMTNEMTRKVGQFCHTDEELLKIECERRKELDWDVEFDKTILTRVSIIVWYPFSLSFVRLFSPNWKRREINRYLIENLAGVLLLPEWNILGCLVSHRDKKTLFASKF